jgi:hypothetical protein
MSDLFRMSRQSDGNLMITGGWVREAKSQSRYYVADGATDHTPGAAQIPLGGNGKNVRISGLVGLNATADIFSARSEREFTGRLLPNWSLVYGADGSVALRDAVTVVATAPPGTVPIRGRISCSATAVSGGDGGGEYLVDLGSATGLVTMNFNAFSVPDHFTVEWGGATVIDSGLRGTNGTYDGVEVVVDGAGTGTLTFEKTTASPTTATVRVVSPYTGTGWEFTLGCPGGSAALYPPSTLADWGEYDLVATNDGRAAYHAGAAFTLKARVEKAVPRTLGVDIFPLAGTGFSGRMERVGAGSFASAASPGWTLSISADGTAALADATAVTATREAGDRDDPSGHYMATAYGAATYCDGVVYALQVSQEIGRPLPGKCYLLLTESAPGTISSVSGPHFSPTLPSPSGSIFPQIIAEVDAAGELIQVQSGTILWGAGGGGGTAIPWITLTSADYLALGSPDPDTIYDINDVIP